MDEATTMGEVPWTLNWAAERLGMDRAVVRALREGMEREVDYRKAGASLVFTEAGLAKLEAAVKAGLEVPPWAVPPDQTWRPFTPEETVVVTFRRALWNPHVVEGEVGGKIVRLRLLHPSPAWRAGMQLPSVAVDVDFYEYRGRPPVAPGVWR